MNTSINSLKIEQFLQQFSLKEALLKKHRNAINALQNANKDINFDTLFSKDPRKLSRNKKFDIQDQANEIIKKCVNELVKNKLSESTITNYLSSIKKLFEQYHINLEPIEWEQIKALQTTYGKMFETKSPKKQEMKKILSNADAIETAFILTMLSSGLRPKDILNIELEDLHLEEKPPRITNKTPNNKKKRRLSYALISKEAKEAIETYIPQRPRYFENKKINILKSTNNYQNNQLNKLFPISDRTIRQRWNNLLIPAELDIPKEEGKKRRQVFNLYSLRSYFRTYLGNADLAEHLIGHKNIANQYYKKQEDEVKKDYILFSNNLFINSETIIPEEAKEKLKKYDEIKQDIIKDLKAEQDKIVKNAEDLFKQMNEYHKQPYQVYPGQDGITPYMIKHDQKTNEPKLIKETDTNITEEDKQRLSKYRKIYTEINKANKT